MKSKLSFTTPYTLSPSPLLSRLCGKFVLSLKAVKMYFMERAWIILAGLLILAAALFLWWGNMDGAFVAGVLGVVAWFLSLRSRLRQANLAAEEASNVETGYLGEQDED